MRRREYLQVSGAVAASAVVAGCNSGGGQPETYSVSGGPGTKSATVKMTSSAGNIFSPHVVWVAEGGTVTWTVASGAHSTTSYSADNGRPQRIPDGASGWDSGTMSSGSFDHTFDVAGVYDYYCVPHEALGMLGSVIVGRPDPSGQPGLADPQNSLPSGAKSEIKKLNVTVEHALKQERGGSGANTTTQ